MPNFEPYENVTSKDISLKNQEHPEQAFIKESEKQDIPSVREAFTALWKRLSNDEEETREVKETINTGINLIKESMILQVLEERGVRNIPRVLRNPQGLPESQSGFVDTGRLVELVTGKNGKHLFTSLAIESIEGEDWAKHKFTTEQGKVDEHSLLSAGIQAAKIFDEVYEAGFMHNDIKPANLMINAKGEVTVIDFNGAERQGGGVCWSDVGTPLYIAPERTNPIITDGRNRSQYKVTGDIYSFAVTLAEKAGTGMQVLTNTEYPPERRRDGFLASVDQAVKQGTISDKLAVFLVWNTGDAKYRNSSFSECMEVLELIAKNDSTAEEIQTFFVSKYQKRQQENAS